jgi:hypothetical protein
MEGGRERRALAARRDVAAPEVGDDRDTGELGEQRRVSDLRGEAQIGPVANRLAVAADRPDGRGVLSRNFPGKNEIERARTFFTARA